MILYVLLNLATEIIDSAEIGCTITGQPHDVNILLQGLLGFAAGIGIVQISIKQDLEYHTGMIAVGASSIISREQVTNIQSIYNVTYNTNKMVGRYFFR